MALQNRVYDPKKDDKVIIALIQKGANDMVIASTLGITTARLQKWRQEFPTLDEIIRIYSEKYIADSLVKIMEMSRKGKSQEAKALRNELAMFNNYYTNHTYVYIPEIITENHVHKRHEIMLECLASKRISLEIAERLSKLIKDNADISKYERLEKKIEELESALRAFINQDLMPE